MPGRYGEGGGGGRAVEETVDGLYRDAVLREVERPQLDGAQRLAQRDGGRLVAPVHLPKGVEGEVEVADGGRHCKPLAELHGSPVPDLVPGAVELLQMLRERDVSS